MNFFKGAALFSLTGVMAGRKSKQIRMEEDNLDFEFEDEKKVVEPVVNLMKTKMGENAEELEFYLQKINKKAKYQGNFNK